MVSIEKYTEYCNLMRKIYFHLYFPPALSKASERENALESFHLSVKSLRNNILFIQQKNLLQIQNKHQSYFKLFEIFISKPENICAEQHKLYFELNQY